MKKAALLVFPIVFMLLFQATGFSVYEAEKCSTSKYDIPFEKLAGTEDAKEFNSYRNELLSYFNQQIRSEFSYKLTVLKKATLTLIMRNLFKATRSGEILPIIP